MCIRMRLTLLAALLMAATACGSYSSPTSSSPMTVNATITAGGFAPNTINVNVGSTVTWTNTDNSPHSVVADGGQFNSGSIAPGGKFNYAFPSAGAFAYHDGANPKMSGMVNVSGGSASGY